VLDGDCARIRAVEIHLHRPGVADAGRVSAGLAVGGEVARQGFVHEPLAGSELHGRGGVRGLAARFEAFGESGLRVDDRRVLEAQCGEHEHERAREYFCPQIHMCSVSGG